MPGLTVLTDNNVNEILHSLGHDDIIRLADSLAEALHTYSTGTQDDCACATNQPERTSIKLKDGTTTLFMPSRSSNSTGIKVVTVAGAAAAVRPSLSSSSSSTTSTTSSTTTLVNSLTNLSLPTTATNTTNITSTTPPSIQGSLTIHSPLGTPLGLLHASTLTAFRTALAATLILRRRTQTHHVVVFGAGQQAYWHIRLALLLRGSDIHHVHIINRSFPSAQSLLTSLHTSPNDTAPWHAHNPHISILTPAHNDYARLLKETIRRADAIFCCTPSTVPLFPAEHLTSTEGRKKGRYISAIGSYTREMCELAPEILKQAVQKPHAKHHHKHAVTAGVVVVDSVTSCLREAGEIAQAGIRPEEMVELGELVMLRRQAIRDGSKGEHDHDDDDGRLVEWLRGGNVIYKSVGLGVMDLAVGNDLLALAEERGVGTRIEGF